MNLGKFVTSPGGCLPALGVAALGVTCLMLAQGGPGKAKGGGFWVNGKERPKKLRTVFVENRGARKNLERKLRKAMPSK